MVVEITIYCYVYFKYLFIYLFSHKTQAFLQILFGEGKEVLPVFNQVIEDVLK